MERIELTEREARFGEAVGCLRHCNARRRGRARESGFPDTVEGGEFVDVLGGQCEAAGQKYLKPIFWNWHVVERFAGIPDLGDWIDVKGVGKRHHKLLVPWSPGPKQGFAYLLVDRLSDKEYDIVGWLMGHQVLGLPVISPHKEKDFPCYSAERGELRPVEELLEAVRKREVA